MSSVSGTPAAFPSFKVNTAAVVTVAGFQDFNTWEDVIVPAAGEAYQVILATAQCTSPTGNSRYDLAIIGENDVGAAYLAFNTQVDGGSPSDLNDAILLTSEPVVIAYPCKLQVREKSTGTAPVGSLSLRAAHVKVYG